MEGISKILGDTLKTKNGDVPITNLSEVKYIALYFTAMWCAPCKLFSPKLKKFYNAVNADSRQFEVVMVSGDDEEDAYEEYYESQPWMAVPFDSDKIQEIYQHYDAHSMPLLILVGSNGEVKSRELKQGITDKGVAYLEDLKLQS